MRIKFLSVIVSFLFVSFAIRSCLDSDDNTYELSSDATVHAFGLDTIYGKHYQFTIDQLRRVIYNRDSLPVGADTIINHILIDTFSVSGWITAGINDTIFDYANDSVDFTPIVNTEAGMKFKIHAPDGTYREYTVQINRHNQDPDSLAWNKMDAYTDAAFAGEQRAVILNEELWIYTNSNQAYRTSTEAGKYGWQLVTLAGYPEDAKPESVVNFKTKAINPASKETVNQTLYIVTDDHKVYSSADGKAWAEVATLGSNINALVTGLTGTLTGITDNGFCTSNDGKSWITNDKGILLSAMPTNFPTHNIYSTSFEASNSLPQVMVVGTPSTNALKLTAPWFSMDGKDWVDMSSTSYDAYCPVMNNPVGMYYGGKFYIFGSKDINKLDAIYSSVTGISWYKTEKKFLLPEEFKNITSPYSIVVDNLNYIWVIFGGDSKPNAVWRGRLNRLGFDIQ